MKISIVTPSLNQGKFIEQTIKSIISQKGDFNLEYIVIDGGSADNSVDTIKKYEELINSKYFQPQCREINFRWISEKDGGQSEAINKGLKMATGEVINWVCSDDLLQPGALQKVADFFKNDEKAKVGFGQNQFIDENGEVFERPRSKKFTRPELIKRWSSVYRKFNLAQPSVFVKREVLDKIGYLDNSNCFCMDYDWYLRINKEYEFNFIDDCLSSTRFHPGCKSIKFEKQQYKTSIDVSKKYWGENTIYYWTSYSAHLPYAMACEISAKLRKKSRLYNNLIDFIKAP